MKLSRSLVFSAVALTLVLATVPTASAQPGPYERPLQKYLTPVEDATCEPLDGDLEYGCRMVFWGFYVFEQQLICNVYPEWWYELCQRAFDCAMPGEPPRDVSGLDIVNMRARC